MKKLKLLFILLLFIVGFTNAQSLPQKLQVAFNKFSSNESLKYASVSFSVLDANSGALIFGDHENTGLASASTLKTITSATALALLGEDYTFKTPVFYTGTIKDGILDGDVIVKGNGDPTLGSWRWESTAKEQVLHQILFALKQKGIKQINGKIIGDDGAWDTQSLPIGWIWQDIGNYYGAGSSTLTWGENQFELTFSPSKTIGGAVKISNQNEVYPFLDIKNELQTGAYGTGDRVYAYSAPYTNLIYLRGTYGADLHKRIGVALQDPALALAYDLDNELHKNQIKTEGFNTMRLAHNNPEKENELTVITSPPLKEIVYWLNQKSINLYAEQLLRTLGWKFGKSASTLDGVKTLQKFWEAQGIDAATLNIVDGSGLSPADKVTSLSMTKVLAFAKKQSWFDAYYKSLPLHNDMKMKSGTINDVLAYAGYAQLDEKTPVCFSLIVNNYTGSISAIRANMFGLLNTLK